MENPFLEDEKLKISMTEEIRKAFEGKSAGDTFEVPLKGYSREYVRAAIHVAMKDIYSYKTKSRKDRIFVYIISTK